jgi:hypothetical protein
MSAALDRLKKRSEFLAVAATNRRWTTPGLVLQARTFDVTGDEAGAAPGAGFGRPSMIFFAASPARRRRPISWSSPGKEP